MFTAISALLAATFAGVLAWKAFANHRPASVFAIESPREIELRILNTNIEHVIFIEYMVSTLEGKKFHYSSWTRHGSEPLDELILPARIGHFIRPADELKINIEWASDTNFTPFMTTIERSTFNYFVTVPSFNIVIRPFGYKNYCVKIAGLIQWLWQKLVCCHEPLKGDIQNPFPKDDGQMKQDDTTGDGITNETQQSDNALLNDAASKD